METHRVILFNRGQGPRGSQRQCSTLFDNRAALYCVTESVLFERCRVNFHRLILCREHVRSEPKLVQPEKTIFARLGGKITNNEAVFPRQVSSGGFDLFPLREESLNISTEEIEKENVLVTHISPSRIIA